MGDWRTDLIREQAGGCGDISPDGERACLLDPNHDGPHGWDDPNTRQEAVERAALLRSIQIIVDDTRYSNEFLGNLVRTSWPRLLDDNNQLRQRLTEAEGLLADFASGGPEDCWLDHHGNCQAHDWTLDASGLSCPHERLRAYRTKYTPEPPE